MRSDTNSSPTLIDQSVILGLLALLHSDTLANLVWWSRCELIQWLDASVKKLARSCGLFVGRSVSDIATVNGTQTYTLPRFQFVSMLHVATTARRCGRRRRVSWRRGTAPG